MSFEEAVRILVDAGLLLLAVIFVVRLTDLRAFVKMSTFDYTIIAAVGSTLAATIIDPDKSAIQGLLMIAALMLAQVIVALIRTSASSFGGLVDSTPLLLGRVEYSSRLLKKLLFAR